MAIKVFGKGNITKDPIIRVSANGTKVASFSIASNRKFRREGEATADFFNCVAFGKTAEFIEKYFPARSAIIVFGRLENTSYVNKDGQTVRRDDVIIEEVEFGEKKGDSSAKADAPAVADVATDDFMNIADDDELPFGDL